MIKKGTFVKFVGTDKLQSVNTYVYGIKSDKFLIEHPQGMLCTDPDVKKHLYDNYSIKIDKPQRFVEVLRSELIPLNKDGSEIQAQPELEENFVDEMVMVQMPKSLLFYLRDSAIQQKKIVDGELDGIPSMLRGPLKAMMSMMKKDDGASETHEQVISALNESILKMIPVKQLLDSAPAATELPLEEEVKQIEQSPQLTPQPDQNV